MMEVIKKYLLKKLFLKRLILSLLAVSLSNLPKRSFVVMLPVLLFLGVLVPLHFADAFVHGLAGQILDIFGALFYLATPFGWGGIALMFGGVLLGLIPVLVSAFILNAVLSGAIITAQYTSGGIVDIGWLITRDIANLAFIAIILVIAVATMLGQQDRGIRLLPKLIGVALLVNFTKVMAGMVVDIANIVTNYFLAPVTNFGNIIVNLFIKETAVWQLITGFIALLQDLSPNPATWLLIIDFLQANFSISAFISNAIGVVMMLIVAMLLSFTLLVFAAIFLVRYIAIWMLVIFSPLAFAAMILPDTSKYAKQWWDEFIKWSFIGVGPAFILYLTAKIIELKDDVYGSFSQAAVAQDGSFIQQILSPVYIIINELLFWVVILVFMWTGLMATMAMNNKVSGIMVKGGMSVLRGAGSYAAQRWGGGAQKWLEQRAGGSQARATLTVPGLGLKLGLGGAIRGGAKFASQKIREAERLKQAQAEVTQMTDGMIDATLKTEGNPTQFKALMEEKIKRNRAKDVEKLLETDDISRGTMEGMVQNLSLRDMEKDIITAFPQYAHASRNVPKEITDPYIKGLFDAGELTKEEAINAQYAKSLNKERVKKIQDSALADRGIIAGLEKNPNVDIFEDLITSSERLDKAIEGYQARYLDSANEQLAKAMKRKNIKTAERLFTGDTEESEKFLGALVETPRKVTFDWLREIGDQHGQEALEKIVGMYRTMGGEGMEEGEEKRRAQKNLFDKNPGLVEASLKNPGRASVFGATPLLTQEVFDTLKRSPGGGEGGGGDDGSPTPPTSPADGGTPPTPDDEGPSPTSGGPRTSLPDIGPGSPSRGGGSAARGSSSGGPTAPSTPAGPSGPAGSTAGESRTNDPETTGPRTQQHLDAVRAQKDEQQFKLDQLGEDLARLVGERSVLSKHLTSMKELPPETPGRDADIENDRSQIRALDRKRNALGDEQAYRKQKLASRNEQL